MKTRTKDDGTKQICIANVMWIDADAPIVNDDKETPIFKD